jgi:two-component system alkaline phosphatase synthesis response regulator PhoP
MKSSPAHVAPRTRVLCVEDDLNLQKAISFILWKEGYHVLCASTGEDAVELVRKEKPDIVLLDILLPGISGYRVSGILKRDPSTAHIPIVIISAKTQVQDIVCGLKDYADDYITKPFEPEILLARIQALLRRKMKAEEKERRTLEIDDLVIDWEAYEVLVSGRKVSLSKTEFYILALMAEKPNQVFTRSRILDHVREDGYPITERVVDYHITGLRKKLGKAKKYIQTVRGVGYKFAARESS